MRIAPRGSPGGSHSASVVRNLLASARWRYALLTPVLFAPILSGCAGSSSAPSFSSRSDTFDSKWGVSSSQRIVTNGPIPKGGGHYKLGRAYQIGGKWYVPRHEPYYDRTGVGSWYGHQFHGRKTANGEIFDMHALTAAHPTLPMPSYAYVTNLRNGRTILVRINDRGPYVADREIDLSRASARALGYEQGGLGKVRVRWAGHAPLNGDDRREQAFLKEQPWAGGSVARYDRPAAPYDERPYRPEQPRYAEDSRRRGDFSYDEPRRQIRGDVADAYDPRASQQSVGGYDDLQPARQPRAYDVAARRAAQLETSSYDRQPDYAAPDADVGQQWSPFDHREQIKRR